MVIMNNVNIPTAGVAKFVVNLAKQQGVSFARLVDDDLADLITRLSDDVVITDDTEDLIVALRRANKIDDTTMIALLGNHLDEIRNV